MTASQPISLSRTLIVEHDPPSQRRLCGLLGAIVGGRLAVTVAGSVREARAAARLGTFDIALLDIGLPDGTGVELIAWLQIWHPRVACLVITAWGDRDTVLAALRAGAIGYMLKDRDDRELSRALEDVQRGGAPIDPFVARNILTLLPDAPSNPEPARPAALEPLTARERAILDLIAHGFNNREIAERTGLSRFTVEDYTKRIYRKLGVGSRAAAVFEAQARGWLRSAAPARTRSPTGSPWPTLHAPTAA